MNENITQLKSYKKFEEIKNKIKARELFESNKDDAEIASILQYLKDQTGIDFIADDYFSGIKTHRGHRYFNIDLGEDTFNSKKFKALQQVAKYSTVINYVEENGSDRVAVFIS